MAHPHDLNCQWCGASRLGKADAAGYRTWLNHVCPNKPPATADEGAAVAFGLMGMAEAIRLRPYCPHGTLLKYIGECLDCWENPYAGEPKCANCGCGLHLHDPACENGAHGWNCDCVGFTIKPCETPDRSDPRG